MADIEATGILQPFKWADDNTADLIEWCTANAALFTGKHNAAAKGKEVNKPLKQWTLVVSPFSTIKVELRCNVSVRPLDLHAFPDANRAFVTVHGTSADQGLKLDNFHVHYNDQDKELLIVAEKVHSNVSVELTTPVKSDLYITTVGSGNVSIQKMESDICRVQTERGHCVLQSVKSHKVLVQSTGGNITGVGTIYGNVDVSTAGDSNVDIKKIQGTTMNVSTERGLLKVKAIYAESSSVSSSSGNIHLGHVHGDATVRSDMGDVIIDSSNGALKVFTNGGNIDTYVGQSGTAELVTQQGTVSIRVPSSMSAGVQLSGASVEISPEITLHEAQHDSTDNRTTITGELNPPDFKQTLPATPSTRALLNGSRGERWIKATAERGAISLTTQSWFETLKLKS